MCSDSSVKDIYSLVKRDAENGAIWRTARTSNSGFQGFRHLKKFVVRLRDTISNTANARQSVISLEFLQGDHDKALLRVLGCLFGDNKRFGFVMGEFNLTNDVRTRSFSPQLPRLLMASLPSKQQSKKKKKKKQFQIAFHHTRIDES